MTNFSRLNRVLVQPAVLTVAMILAAQVGHAQQQRPTPPGAAGQQQPSPKQQEFMKTRAELQQLQQQLGKIQEKVLQDNPDLQKRQEDFRDLMMTKMKDQGATPEQDVKKLKSLQSELQKQDIPKDKRQRMIQEFRQTNMALQEAQKKAMQDKEVQQAQKSLNDAMLTAMVDANPDTQELLDRVKQARQKLMKIRQEVNASGN